MSTKKFNKVRGIILDGEQYMHRGDLLLYLASVGELANLNDDNRRMISALLGDLRHNSRTEFVRELTVQDKEAT